jgi:tyrosyl-tRNA synthetase
MLAIAVRSQRIRKGAEDVSVKEQAKQADIEKLLRRGVVLIEKEADLRRMLVEGRGGEPLRVKLGVDPSHPELTIGHAVVFRKLRQFQQLGHKAVVVVGDWTARLGDPSGRENARKPLSAEQVKANAATYLEQFYRIVDRQQTEVRWQSEWFDDFTLADVMRLLSYKTVAQMLARDDFAKRYKSGIEIYLSEFMYPLLQGYDSVALHADVEIGGTDQTFNLLVGRELQPLFGQPPQQIMTVQLIVGLDGHQKMGKSLQNYIALTAPPGDMYGKLMSLPDHAMMSYFETLTDVPLEELEELQRKLAEGLLNPMVVKRRMAREIVGEFHGPAAAEQAEEAFIRQFSERKLPEQLPEYRLTGPAEVTGLLVEAGLVSSKSEARRLIQQGGVTFFPHGAEGEAQTVTTPDFLVPAADGAVLKVGKLRYLRIRTGS